MHYENQYRKCDLILEGRRMDMGIAMRTEASLSYPRMQETLPAHTRMWQLLLLCDVRLSSVTALAQNPQTHLKTQTHL